MFCIGYVRQQFSVSSLMPVSVVALIKWVKSDFFAHLCLSCNFALLLHVQYMLYAAALSSNRIIPFFCSDLLIV